MTHTGTLPNLGTQQSPIALEDVVDAVLDVRVNWSSLKFTSKVDDRKWGVDPNSGHVRVAGERYVPVEWHVHFPVEHTLRGNFRGEVHIVHVHAKDLELVVGKPQAPKDWWRLFVIGVFLKVGKQPHAPFSLNKAGKVPREALLPGNPGMLVYRGSLTTPPYSENVTFGIFTDAMTLTSAQLKKLASPRNARALQGRNRRYVLRTEAKFGRG